MSVSVKRSADAVLALPEKDNGKEAPADGVKSPKLDRFNWTALSHLFKVMAEFLTFHCSWKRLDGHRIKIVDRLDCKPEDRGTHVEKQVVWTWRSDDFRKPVNQRSRTRKLRPRNHELLLRRGFCEFDLDVEKNWVEWTVRISIPESEFDEKHHFRDLRGPLTQAEMQFPESSSEEEDVDLDDEDKEEEESEE